ncbi:MAG: acetyl ornithine aminotransferase family protein [Anaerolineales bacterium]|nr:acetyl ornithine aminotransferase family protein [Anaerolineales bacterium]
MIKHNIGPKAREIISRDEDILATSYSREYPLVVDHALGSELWDVDGRRYVDMMAGVGVLNVGHRHPQVVEAVREQIDKFWHICLHDFYYPQAVELAEKMATIAPMSGHTRYYFGNSGTEAVEAAIKLATIKTDRHKFVGFIGAFHGRTLGSLSFTASKVVQSGRYPKGVNVYHVPFANPYRPVLACAPGEDYGDAVVNYLDNELFSTKLHPEDVAAIVVEPIQGEGGYVVPAPNFFPRLREMCDKYGILLIVDEIQSGVGRTGRWWAIEHEEVEPDIVCFAKGIASGMPLGGIAARDEVMAWEPGAHGSTFGGNPVALASAIATLDVIEQEGLLAQAEKTGNSIMASLQEMQQRHPYIGDVRGRGLMIGMEFVEDRRTKKRAKAFRDAVIEYSFEKGLLVIPCGTNSLRMTPPLNISADLVEEGLHILDEAMSAAEALVGREFLVPVGD